MLRTSSYTIYVDLPDDGDAMLLVHGYSGAYDRVSRRVATYLRAHESGRPPRPLYGEWSPEPAVDGEITPPSEQTMALLQRRGYLTELSAEDETALFMRVANRLHALQSQPSYIFMPTYDCNLRCAYCFQDHMRTDTRYQHLLRTMRPEIVDRIFDALPQIEAYHNVPAAYARRTMGFFGGEPLLERSRKIVEYIIAKAHATAPTAFWAITNGTQLETYRDLLGPGRIESIQITLDGPPAEHDRRRIHADGSGSFARIARNLTMALEQGTQVQVRMNIDRTNIAQLPELAAVIVEQGWHEHPGFVAYTAPIIVGNDHTDIKTTFSTYELDRALDDMRAADPRMQIIQRPDDKVVHSAQLLFSKQDRPSQSATFCGAHNGMYLFDAFADIYACWERTGDQRIRIGAITDAGEFTLEGAEHQKWRSRNVTTNPICRKCRYSLYCGGGCAVLAENHRGEFFTNHCDGFAARFRSSVAEAYGKHMIGLEPVAVGNVGCDY